MKRMYAYVAAMIIVVTSLSACREQVEDFNVDSSATLEDKLKSGVEAKEELAKVLAQALIEKEVRQFLKNESLAKFDGDYDVLYSLVKDKKLASGRTFEQCLAKYAPLASLQKWADKSPLSTIYVPTITGFAPETWDIESQIPDVVVDDSNLKNRDTTRFTAYTKTLKRYTVSTKMAPNTPVVVIKENERIIAKSNRPNGSRRINSLVEIKSTKVIGNDFNHSFYFIGDVDPKQANKSRNARLTSPNELPHILRWAYAEPDYPYGAPIASNKQRDWVYYAESYYSDLSRGSMLDYTERLRGIKFNNSYGLKNVTENWNEGFLEFHLYLSFVHRNGGMQSDLKVFYCSPADISSRGTPIEYNPDVELMPWDLYRYGDEWKLRLLEHDPGGSSQTTISMKSTFGTNWETSAGIEIKAIKLGSKFGVSQTFETSGSQTISISDVSDQLGDARFLFDDPIITGFSTDLYPGWGRYGFLTYGVNTGAVELSIEPVAKSPDPRSN